MLTLLLRRFCYLAVVICAVTVSAQDTKETNEVPFEIIEKVPVYPGCFGSTNANLKTCMSDKISYHVGNTFDMSIADSLGIKSGIVKIFVRFKINTKGEIGDVSAKAPHKALGAEAERVISLLPKMTPGQQRGEAINVLYTLPIVYNYTAPKPSKKKKRRRNKKS